jgi:hypothetical protein
MVRLDNYNNKVEPDNFSKAVLVNFHKVVQVSFHNKVVPVNFNKVGQVNSPDKVVNFQDKHQIIKDLPMLVVLETRLVALEAFLAGVEITELE